MKKILLIYHSNICNKNCGINSYLYNIFKLLNKRGFIVDIFVPYPFDDKWDISSCEFINNIFLDDNRNFGKKEDCLYYFKTVLNRFLIKFFNLKKGKLDWITDRNKERFKEVVKNNKYECVFFSYIYYSKLLDFIPEDILKVGSISDFVSIQQMEVGNFKFGEVIDEEIAAIDKFDKALFISSDEMTFFSNFMKNVESHYLPHCLSPNISDKIEKDVDILFLGSDNSHNVSGISWFLKDIYPKIEKNNYKIIIAGKITTKIDKAKYPKIEFIGYVEKIDQLYNRTKLAISPLNSGTGIKIKIVEALGYGIPVVCTSRSLFGLMEKINNGCIAADSPEDFASAIAKVLKDDNYRNQISKQSRMHFEKYFNEKYSEQILLKVFK